MPSVVGDLRQTQAQVVMHDEDGPLLDRQAAEAALQLVAVGLIAAARSPRPARSRRQQRAPPRTRLRRRRDSVVAGVDEQAVEPGVAAVDVAQPPQPAPGPDEALLDRVLAAVAVTQDALGEGVQPVVGGAGKHVERFDGRRAALAGPGQPASVAPRPEGRLPSSPSIDAMAIAESLDLRDRTC